MKPLTTILILFVSLSAIRAEENEQTFRVAGLFQPDQVEPLRKVFGELEDLDLVDVNYERGEATIRFGERFVAGGDAEKQRAAISQQLRGATRGVFDVQPAVATPREQLKEIVIPVAGLDCKGCSYGAYLAVDQLEGVARATADFGEGRVTAWIDPDKITIAELEVALAKKQIGMNYRIDEPGLVPAGEMSIVRVSSDDPGHEGNAAHAIDGDQQTIWHTRFAGEVAEPPHELVIDLGKTRTIAGFRYLARQKGDVGQFAETEFYVSDDAESFGNEPTLKTTFQPVKSAQSANCAKPVSGRYVLVRVVSEINEKPNATAAEIGVIEAK
ncbi:MAG: hypothetical protein ACI8UO_005657 [Verrucomicrobiales bacterium]|jgi:hypothetical protein